MKMKKFLPAIALTLGFSVLAAGCVAGNKTVAFSPFWQQNNLTSGEPIDETLTYKVAFEKGSGLENINYSFAYENGTYTTQLVSKTEGDTIIYEYRTKFSIDVTYTLNGVDSDPFTDTVETYAKFYGGGNLLKPVESSKTTVSHSPRSGSEHASLTTCYSEFNQTVETKYNADGSGSCTVTDNTLEKNNKSTTNFTKDEKYTCIDNETLLLALRAISASTTSATVEVYNQVVNAMQKINISFVVPREDQETGDREFAYKEMVDGEWKEVKKAISYREVNLSLKDKNPGTTQTAWVAQSAPTANTYRNMLLRIEMPLAYDFGTLIYSLDSVDRK